MSSSGNRRSSAMRQDTAQRHDQKTSRMMMMMMIIRLAHSIVCGDLWLATADKINTIPGDNYYYFILNTWNQATNLRQTLLSRLVFWGTTTTPPSPSPPLRLWFILRVMQCHCASAFVVPVCPMINNKTCSLRLWSIRKTAYLMKLHFNAVLDDDYQANKWRDMVLLIYTHGLGLPLMGLLP